jgi:preprotein translocase subunit SecA
VVERTVLASCPGEFLEDWDVDELQRTLQLVYPSRVSRADIEQCLSRDRLVEVVVEDALAQYEAKEQELPVEDLREIERRVMLSMIDQHWREHLYEMDYLREGIGLRAMGQKDPLAEWQREGFDMFEAMMAQVQDNFVAYVSHLRVVVDEGPTRPRLSGVRYSAPEDPVQGARGMTAVAAARPGDDFDGDGLAAAPVPVAEAVAQQPVHVERTPGRNDPCFCGSGKKYKLCHGR